MIRPLRCIYYFLRHSFLFFFFIFFLSLSLTFYGHDLEQCKTTAVLDKRFLVFGLYKRVPSEMCLRHCTKSIDSNSSYACAKSHPGICFPLIYSIMPNDSVSRQWRPWSNCVDAQADLGFHCQVMPYDIVRIAQPIYRLCFLSFRILWHILRLEALIHWLTL